MLTQLEMQAGGMDSTVQATDHRITDPPKKPNTLRMCLYPDLRLQESYFI